MFQACSTERRSTLQTLESPFFQLIYTGNFGNVGGTADKVYYSSLVWLYVTQGIIFLGGKKFGKQRITSAN